VSERRNPPIRTERIDTAHAALLDPDATDFLERMQAIVCETTRAQILRALRVTTLTVTELTLVLDCSKWTASRHLRTLRESGLVRAQRRGRYVSYRLGGGPIVEAALAALEAVEATTRENHASLESTGGS